MAAKTRRRKQSNLSLSDGPTQQPLSTIHQQIYIMCYEISQVQHSGMGLSLIF